MPERVDYGLLSGFSCEHASNSTLSRRTCYISIHCFSFSKRLTIERARREINVPTILKQPLNLISINAIRNWLARSARSLRNGINTGLVILTLGSYRKTVVAVVFV